MQGTIKVTPAIIWRVRPEEDKLEVVNVPADGPYEETEETGERALLVFKNPELAGALRADNNCYPASEGFRVVAMTPGDLEATCESCGLQRVALWGLEPYSLGVLDAGEFIALLKLGKMAAEDGLLD